MSPFGESVAASAADQNVSRADGFARNERLRVARADFFLGEDGRLTDEERALMAAALRQLVADMADELLALLPSLDSARSDGARSGLYQRLRHAGLLDRAGIVALLLRRADEQRLRGARANVPDSIISAMVGDPDAAIADGAMALTIARGRRRDRYGRIGLEFDDLDAEDAVALVYAVAAALTPSGETGTEQAILDAARHYLAQHDEGRRLEAVVAAFAHTLVQAGRDDDVFLGLLADEREAFLLVAIMAERAGVDLNEAWSMFVHGDAMLIARLAGCDRAVAARLIAAFDQQLDLDADQAIEQFDSTDEARISQLRRAMRTNPYFRVARLRLEMTNG